MVQAAGKYRKIDNTMMARTVLQSQSRDNKTSWLADIINDNHSYIEESKVLENKKIDLLYLGYRILIRVDH